MNKKNNSQIIESLIYLYNWTRHDITYSVSRSSRCISNPSIKYRVLQNEYLNILKKHFDFWFRFVRYPSILEDYSNANWIYDSFEINSIYGYFFSLGGSVISLQLVH